MDDREEQIWMSLAGLFFRSERLNSDEEILAAVRLLRSAGWSRRRAKRALLTVVVPHAKRNLGYGLPLALGEERAVLDREELLPKMRRSDRLRKENDSWLYFAIPDWLNRRVMKKVGADRLLDLL